jgi:hypothetical protein
MYIFSSLNFEENPLFLSENWLGSVGLPIEVSRKGENPAFRAGKRQVFPSCEPDRVTAEALKRGNNGFSLPDLGLQRRLIGSLSLIRIFEENLDINPLTGIRRQWNIGLLWE